MSRCKTVSFFYALIPLRGWKGYLIQRHIEGCARCQAALASRVESRTLFVKAEAVSFGRPLWTAIELGLAREVKEAATLTGRRAPLAMYRRQWAVAAALLLVLVTGYWILKDFQPEAVSAAAAAPARFELAYARIDGQPANVVIYQPQGSDMIIVWAGKNR